MAWAEKRKNDRWVGRFVTPEGTRRNAGGTFATQAEALRAAERREQLGSDGDVLDLTIAEYVERWTFSEEDHGNMLQTRVGHRATLRKYVIPLYGNRRVRELEQPRFCRRLITEAPGHPQACRDASRRVRNSLGSILRPLVESGVLEHSPIHGIRLPKQRTAVTALPSKEQFAEIVKAFENPAAQFLARFLVWTGMRPGEAFALRVSDIQWASERARIHQRRTTYRGRVEGEPAVIEALGSKTHSQRTVSISSTQAEQLRSYIQDHSLGDSDLLYPKRLIDPTYHGPGYRTDLDDWDPHGDYGTFMVGGHTTRHGTTTGYAKGCRCCHCKAAVTLYTRRARRRKAEKQGRPVRSGRSKFRAPEDDHMRVDRWGVLWNRAIEKANVGWKGKPYSTRSMAATYMLEAGYSLVKVQEILGHTSPTTTMHYLRLVENQWNDATSALDDV